MSRLAEAWRSMVRSGALTKGPRRRFAVVSFIDSVGTGLFLPLMVLFFTRSAGLGAGQVALGLTLAGMAALAATPAGGHLLDRYDPRLVLVASYGIRALVYALYSVVHSVETFIPLVCLAQAAAQVGRSARTMVVAGMGYEEERVRLLAGVSTIRNLGVGLGSLGAGAALAADTRTAYLAVVWINAVSYLLAGLLVRTLPGAPRRREPGAVSPGSIRAVLRNRRFTALTVLNAVFLLNDAVLAVGVPLWLTMATEAPAALTGLLFTLNTGLVVALQVPLSRSSQTFRGAGRAYVHGGAALLVACILFVLAGEYSRPLAIALMLTGVAALTVAEVWSVAAGWSVSLGLAPAEQRGRHLAVFSLGEGFASSAGPAVVTIAVVRGGTVGWIALGAATALAGVLAWRLCRIPEGQATGSSP